MKNLITRFVHEDSGQDMIEYVLILAFVCIGAAAIITTVGSDITTVWTAASKHASNAAAAAS